jgi:hypothetical protein
MEIKKYMKNRICCFHRAARKITRKNKKKQKLNAGVKVRTNERKDEKKMGLQKKGPIISKALEGIVCVHLEQLLPSRL